MSTSSALTQTIPADDKARGYIFGTPDGVTYGVYAEAPFAKLGGAEPIGGISRLEQTQSFIKVSPDATLKFTLTGALISAGDMLSRGGADDLISGELYLEVHAYTTSRSFFHTAGGATVTGTATRWVPEVWNYRFSRTPLWSEGDFQFDTSDFVDPRFAPCGGVQAALDLKAPRTYAIDLSSIAVGEKFTLKTFAFAKALNRRGGGAAGDCEASAALAYLRDPLEIGGTTVSFTGLQPTADPLLQPPAEVPVAPAACVPGPGPDPAAGTLQFSAASYAIGEFAGATPTVRVTRSGGSRGAVTATFTTSDGSAVAGADYTAVNVSVFFADGDATPRAVEVPIVVDRIVEPDKTVNLTLSQPGGCAALGTQTTAVLTILDDDPPPLATIPTGIDNTFGTAGKATLERFGGDRSGMALQADGKIVMVGGTFVDFILARFNADGSVDRSFGIDGKVTTDMGSGLRQEEALAVAIQSDGKIVVVGQAAIDATPPAPDLPATFAIARYNSDGSLDAGFGTGGRVSGSVNGIARAVAIQPDGKIVLAGDFELELSNGVFVSDIVVARFNADGSLDLPFGTSGTGQVATDIGGGREQRPQPGAAAQRRDRRQRHAAVRPAGVRPHRRRSLQRQRHARPELRQWRQADAGRSRRRPGAGAAGRRQAGAGGDDRASDRSGDGALRARASQWRRQPRPGLRQRRHGEHGTERERRCPRDRTAGRRQAGGRRHACVLAESELRRRALRQQRLSRHRLRQLGHACRSTSSASKTSARTCSCNPTAGSSSAGRRATSSMATGLPASTHERRRGGAGSRCCRMLAGRRRRAQAFPVSRQSAASPPTTPRARSRRASCSTSTARSRRNTRTCTAGSRALRSSRPGASKRPTTTSPASSAPRAATASSSCATPPRRSTR